MAKPMFFYAGVYDSVHDADADYEAIKALYSADVIGIDRDAEQIERAATRAKDSILKREFGDFEEAEQEALAAIAQAERAG